MAPAPRPGAPRSGASRPGAQRRAPQSHRAGPEPRILLIGVLVVATLVGGWWFLLRDDSVQSPEFVKAERNYVEAARAIPALADQIQVSKLVPFNRQVDRRLAEMQGATDVLRRLANQEEGSAAQIAQDAANAATRGITELTRFARAIVASANLSDAAAARSDLEATIAELERHARDWNNLG